MNFISTDELPSDTGVGGAIDLVGLKQVDPAVDHKGDAFLENRRRSRRCDQTRPRVMTLLTMMLVPPAIGGPRLITNSLF